MFVLDSIIKDKNITVCVTGGIAAYKAVYLCSFLKKKGAIVRVIMSKSATEFVTPLTFKSITNNPVITTMFDNSDFIPHIGISELSDIIIVAPATANCIAKAASGIADDMISTVLLSATCPKIIVPAMNTQMYVNPVTQRNINTIKNFGFLVMEPDTGLMACGTTGVGRFPEIESIYGFIIQNCAARNHYFSGKKVLITAGGTIEDIDPVRYISNRSSGKTAFAFAETFISLGASVTIIAGNVSDIIMDSYIKKYGNENIISVRSAHDMKKSVEEKINSTDILCMCAAVADYTTECNTLKIKKNENTLNLSLIKTLDILGSLHKKTNQVFIGFAAESNNLELYASEKLNKKSLDFVIANQITGEKTAFGGDKSELIVLSNTGKRESFFYKSKNENAYLVLEYIARSLS
ncbi:MAG: hypothetical protein A2015_09035 [Spirochaetes bacterium GWF1_31_7]|nr:MAG: hypothetical protein A2Y30_09185 [Spirochaetes bacterium GWE1_32_154]OHD46618.1 MAG: hypothetical protein A2Y29_07670 [Spirochaetes bacterium GWE2_31_10]OHD47632.1 MAG: hypothetical protein A2015_09035 [Spirochaetes bacterium GWF1_31_7]HBD94410.1 bifunctional phosphopantothenoylcysteine decarboxylase/phosphopantothenate--cysteine ligase CoaBC [Spirochaetia bacterium]HBI37655.1 bifunctional phosphopantothenoylcysteine decarboxylase/phosphopantothenate--cysteine ligase CoaBC [Spirochaetia